MIAARPTISRETLTRIVEAAGLAPSAENLQPWRFRIEEDSILVLLDLTRQLPSDVGRMLGLTGIGTAIENAVVAASYEGLATDVDCVYADELSRSTGDTIPVVRLRFEESDEQSDALKKYIADRCTTRRMEATRIEQDTLKIVGNSVCGFESVELHWVDEGRLPAFARLVGLGNRIRFEHRPFHAELYHSLRFDAAEIARTRDGLDVTTLQLPFGVAGIMYLLRTWPRMRVANLLGFSRGVERQATAEVMKSGALGFISVPTADAGAFVEGGRSFERMWLTATQLGLCFHPTASLPVFIAVVTEACCGGR
jgi:hypothetical protein